MASRSRYSNVRVTHRSMYSAVPRTKSGRGQRRAGRSTETHCVQRRRHGHDAQTTHIDRGAHGCRPAARMWGEKGTRTFDFFKSAWPIDVGGEVRGRGEKRSGPPRAAKWLLLFSCACSHRRAPLLPLAAVLPLGVADSPSFFHSSLPIRVDRAISRLLQPLIDLSVRFMWRDRARGTHGLRVILSMQDKGIAISSVGFFSVFDSYTIRNSSSCSKAYRLRNGSSRITGVFLRIFGSVRYLTLSVLMLGCAFRFVSSSARLNRMQTPLDPFANTRQWWYVSLA
jgi:hypothetical protein